MLQYPSSFFIWAVGLHFEEEGGGGWCKAVVPNLGGIPPPQGGIWPSLGGNEQLSETIQHLFGLKIHLIYNYKASDSLNFHEIKFNWIVTD